MEDRTVKQTKLEPFCFRFSKPSLISSPCDDAATMQRGGRCGGDVAHPGVLDDEEEDAEELAGDEDEGNAGVDEAEVGGACRSWRNLLREGVQDE